MAEETYILSNIALLAERLESILMFENLDRLFVYLYISNLK